tara:strand:+ start:141 stop:515 length:375 start_codon:yes stop_codon:yes gene_type:complete
MTHALVFRVRDPHDLMNGSGMPRTHVRFWTRRRGWKIPTPGTHVVAIMTRHTDFGREVAVPGVYRVVRAPNVRGTVDTELMTWYGTSIGWTRDLKSHIGDRVQAGGGRAQPRQIVALRDAGVMV